MRMEEFEVSPVQPIGEQVSEALNQRTCRKRQTCGGSTDNQVKYLFMLVKGRLWPARKKFLSISIVSLMVLLSPTISTVSSPIAPGSIKDFNSTNRTLSACVTTVFLIGYTFGPCLIARPYRKFWYGCAACYPVHWIIPIIGPGLIGTGMVIAFMATTMYHIDAFTIYTASATAANTVLRCLLTGLTPLVGPAMYANLGYGWGNSLLGSFAVVFIPVPFMFYNYGERIPESRIFKIEF